MQNTSYPTDLTDTQWQLLQPLLPPPKKRGRKPADRRRLLSALFYILRAGCAWRLLPKDFGPWQTVYHYFRLWSADGTWEAINELLRRAVRAAAGKRAQPTAAILDSQTVRSADHAGDTGYDAAKKTKGRKRPILVDPLGLLLWGCVTPADVDERAGARRLLAPALKWWRWLRTLFVDGGYSGEDFAGWVASHRKTGTLAVQVVSRAEGQRGFAVLPKRWIVERTFGWFVKQRRLVRDYETKTQHAEAWLYLTLIGLMLRRLA
jgi:putative transposase